MKLLVPDKLLSILIIGFLVALFVLPTFFFWRWRLKKYIKVVRKRKIATWLATIVLTPLIYYGCLKLLIISMSYYPDLHFDKTRWETYPYKRYKLSKDLIESKILMGKSRMQVRQFLGYDATYDDSSDLYYGLGYTPALFGIDPNPYILKIDFENNRVISVKQYKEWGN